MTRCEYVDSEALLALLGLGWLAAVGASDSYIGYIQRSVKQRSLKPTASASGRGGESEIRRVDAVLG
ncbi:hypothetical protein MHYP_G00171020 [Metynnis hypsauchen]